MCVFDECMRCCLETCVNESKGEKWKKPASELKAESSFVSVSGTFNLADVSTPFHFQELRNVSALDNTVLQPRKLACGASGSRRHPVVWARQRSDACWQMSCSNMRDRRGSVCSEDFDLCQSVLLM